MAKMTFETAMKQLEQIVQDLETGDMPLEKAIKKFEEGIKISKYCSEKLNESERRITLLMQDPDGKNHPIQGIVQIGRDRLNHVHLKDPMISRLHATAWVDGEKVFLQDEGSSNGTFVNGMPVGQPIALQVGDKAQMGHTTLILVDTRAGWIHESPPPLPIEPAPPPPPETRSIGFPLAMIVLAGLTVLACAIITAVVLRFSQNLRAAPASSAAISTALPARGDNPVPHRFTPVETKTATLFSTRSSGRPGICLVAPLEAPPGAPGGKAPGERAVHSMCPTPDWEPTTLKTGTISMD